MGAEMLFMVALHSRRSALQNNGNQDKLSQPMTILIYPEGRVCWGQMHCFRTPILRYCRYHRPVASRPPPWLNPDSASNLERKFDNCQPGVRAPQVGANHARIRANPRP